MPAEDLPHTRLVNFPFFDKVVHAGMYLIFAVLLARPLKTAGLPGWFWILMIPVFAGGVIEILQFVMTSTRSASWGDFFSDCAGAVAGLVGYRWWIAGSRWEKYI